MGRKKKIPGFRNEKMFSGRVEQEDYDKALYVIKTLGKTNIQSVVNMLIVGMISGSLKLSEGRIVEGDGVAPNQPVKFHQPELYLGDFGVKKEKNNSGEQ